MTTTDATTEKRYPFDLNAPVPLVPLVEALDAGVLELRAPLWKPSGGDSAAKKNAKSDGKEDIGQVSQVYIVIRDPTEAAGVTHRLNIVLTKGDSMFGLSVLRSKPGAPEKMARKLKFTIQLLTNENETHKSVIKRAVVLRENVRKLEAHLNKAISDNAEEIVGPRPDGFLDTDKPVVEYKKILERVKACDFNNGLVDDTPYVKSGVRHESAVLRICAKCAR